MTSTEKFFWHGVVFRKCCEDILWYAPGTKLLWSDPRPSLKRQPADIRPQSSAGSQKPINKVPADFVTFYDYVTLQFFKTFQVLWHWRFIFLLFRCCDRSYDRFIAMFYDKSFFTRLVTAFVTGFENNSETSLVTGCYGIAMWLLCDCYVVAMERIFSWYLVAMWLVCGCYEEAI